MREVLVARGYDPEYVEFNGVHGELNWQHWLAEGFVHLPEDDRGAAAAADSRPCCGGRTL